MHERAGAARIRLRTRASLSDMSRLLDPGTSSRVTTAGAWVAVLTIRRACTYERWLATAWR